MIWKRVQEVAIADYTAKKSIFVYVTEIVQNLF